MYGFQMPQVFTDICYYFIAIAVDRIISGHCKPLEVCFHGF
jgi:hypothetical protein